MTTGSDMRGSTLLLHWKSEATLMYVQLRSALHLLLIADLAPLVGSLVSLAGYSSSSTLGICHLFCVQYNGDGKKMQASTFSLSVPLFPIILAR